MPRQLIYSSVSACLGRVWGLVGKYLGIVWEVFQKCFCECWGVFAECLCSACRLFRSVLECWEVFGECLGSVWILPRRVAQQLRSSTEGLGGGGGADKNTGPAELDAGWTLGVDAAEQNKSLCADTASSIWLALRRVFLLGA